ncbi:ribonuclease H [Trifolium pratense]|uniref:Ribonuclease H n=1 Tax=Trifolium pratense TaxID=57577 RepID=A0A2K3P8R1_TRIPR|nr:ribonuclease H [Trifolium pratense]
MADTFPSPSPLDGIMIWLSWDKLTARKEFRGDGRTINIWKESWLKSQENLHVTSPLVQGCESMMVADRLDQEAKLWRWDIINSMFNQKDREEIHKMAATFTGSVDKQTWKFDSKGNYTVKSAYRFVTETLIDNMKRRISGNWMSIWNLRIPHGCLSTRDKLQSKGVPCTDQCSYCERAQQVWESSRLGPAVYVVMQRVKGITAAIFLCFVQFYTT